MTDVKDDNDNGLSDGRGPGYPVISLERAIARAELVRDAGVPRSSLPVAGVLKLWGYQSASGPARRQIAALKHYGLLEYSGSGKDRKIKLTDLALKIILDKVPNSPARAAALKEAALKPPIFARLIDTFPMGIGTDEGFETHLTLNEHYSEDAAKTVMNVFRDTLSFSGLDKPDNMSPKDEEKPESNKINDLEPENPDPSKTKQEPKIMQGERIIFTEEESPQQHLRLIAAGDLNEYLLEALEDFIKRQRKRLGIA